MKKLMQIGQNFWREEDGAVAIEYGLLAALIALAIIAGAGALGDGLDAMFQGIAAYFGTVPVPTP